MNTFNIMSDLIADAEDLVLRIGKSADPRVSALKAKVEASIEDLRRQARQRIKRSRHSAKNPRRAAAYGGWVMPVTAIAAGIASAILVYRLRSGRPRLG